RAFFGGDPALAPPSVGHDPHDREDRDGDEDLEQRKPALTGASRHSSPPGSPPASSSPRSPPASSSSSPPSRSPGSGGPPPAFQSVLDGGDDAIVWPMNPARVTIVEP